MITGHGGNKAALAGRIGCRVEDIVDMSANLNPLGPPATIQEILARSLEEISSLPEPDAAGMVNAFSRYYGVAPSRVMAGNGTTFFIYTLPLALRISRALIVGPTYSDYQDACLAQNVVCDHLIADPADSFRPDPAGVAEKLTAADLVFWCNPNNPTGTLTPPAQILDLVREYPETIFVVDESYLPFVDNAPALSLIGETGYSNLVVLSSMSKIFTIPGLRTGFLTAHEAVISKLMTHYQPWSVNALAQTVLRRVFENPVFMDPFIADTREFVKTQRQWFLRRLENQKGIVPFESVTSFILAALEPEMTSKTFCRRVGDEKILIRDCANFTGLTDRFVRFSLKTESANHRLAEVIRTVLSHAE